MAKANHKKLEIAVVLHDIRSLHNVGSIFRTADGAGVGKIYLCGITPSPEDRLCTIRAQFAKVALGAEQYVPWERARPTVSVIKKLKSEKYRIFAVEQAKNAVSYRCVGYQSSGINKIALIVGGEVRGLPPSVLKLADKILEIPMRGAMVRQARHPRYLRRGKESLNVSVAFGIVVFNIRHEASGFAVY